MITKGQKKKPPDLQLIAGSFNGINGVLSAFSEVVSQTTVGEIFRLLVLCCNPNVSWATFMKLISFLMPFGHPSC